MSEYFHSLHLTVTHTTEPTLKSIYKHFYVNIYQFQNKPHFGRHLEFLKMLNDAKSNEIVCDKNWAIVSRIHWKQYNFYINIDYIHNKLRFGGHLVSLASFRIFNTNIFSNKINNKQEMSFKKDKRRRIKKGGKIT